MDRRSVMTRRLSYSLYSTPCRRRDSGFQTTVLQDIYDRIDNSRFPGTRTARYDADPHLQGAGHRMFLILRKKDPRRSFCPLDQAVDFPRNRFQPRIVDHRKTLADILFRKIIGHEKHDRPIVQVFHMDLSGECHLCNIVLYLLHGQIQHLSGFFTKLRLRKECISLSCKISQCELDPALDPKSVIMGDPHFFRDLIRLLKPDTENIVHQLVRILFDRLYGICSIYFIQLHRVMGVYTIIL